MNCALGASPIADTSVLSSLISLTNCPYNTMTPATKRSIVRWIHIVFSIPIIGYVYSPFENIPQYAGPTRFVFLPALVVTGLWMWKGHVVRRLFARESPRS